nr:SGNH hydrolase domain-containing protein [Litorivivens lipolytica]
MGASGYFTKGLPTRFQQELFVNWEDTDRCTKQGVRSETELAEITGDCFPSTVDKKYILIGDSHAETVSKPLRRVIEANNGALITLIDKGCLPIPGTSRYPIQKNCIFAKDLFWRIANQTDATVILSARWRLYFEGTRYNNGEGGVEYGDNWANYVFDNTARDIYQYTRDELIDLALKNPVVILSQIPETGWKVPEVVAKYRKYRNENSVTVSTSYEIYLEKNRQVNRWLRELESHETISVLRTEDIVCDFSTMRCANARNGVSLYRDNNHPSPRYAAMIAQKFKDLYLHKNSAVDTL